MAMHVGYKSTQQREMIRKFSIFWRTAIFSCFQFELNAQLTLLFKLEQGLNLIGALNSSRQFPNLKGKHGVVLGFAGAVTLL